MRLPDRIRPSLVEWFYLAAGAAWIVHRRWLFDDAFIYFRYVDNCLFLHGGLTFNVGEYVEGYTSPGFCLLLCLLRATHAGFPTIILSVGLVSWAVCWYLLVVLNRRMAPPGAAALNLPLLFLCANYGVTSFFTSGLETPLVHLAAVAYALFVLRPSSRGLALVVAASPMARPELFASLGLAAIWSWWREQRFPAWLAGASVLINGAWLLYRVRTYADVLPNTFYLKDGTNWAMGFRYLSELSRAYQVAPTGAVMLVLFLILWKRRKRDAGLGPLEGAARGAMIAIAGVVTLYVVRVGGAAIHYHYLAFPFVLGACATAGLGERALSATMRGRKRWLVWPIAVGGTVIVGALHSPGMPEYITDPKYYREKESFRPSRWTNAVAIDEQEAFAKQVHATGYLRIIDLGRCRDLYVQFRTRAVHRYGLTDGVLSRIDTPEHRRGHKPGLRRPAKDIVAIEQEASTIGRGMFREAVDAGRAPDWVRENLDTIEILEKKMYNRHDPAENLRLAFTFPPKIGLGESAPGIDTEVDADDFNGSDEPSPPDGD